MREGGDSRLAETGCWEGDCEEVVDAQCSVFLVVEIVTGCKGGVAVGIGAVAVFGGGDPRWGHIVGRGREGWGLRAGKGCSLTWLSLSWVVVVVALLLLVMGDGVFLGAGSA